MAYLYVIYSWAALSTFGGSGGLSADDLMLLADLWVITFKSPEIDLDYIPPSAANTDKLVLFYNNSYLSASLLR